METDQFSSLSPESQLQASSHIGYSIFPYESSDDDGWNKCDNKKISVIGMSGFTYSEGLIKE